MWGNKLGWGLSLIVVVLFALLLYLISHAGDASSPTPGFKADPENLAVITLPLEPETVVAMGDEQDAAKIYRDAMAAYGLHNHDFEAFVDTVHPDRLKRMRADRKAAVIAVFDDQLIPATHFRNLNLFGDNPAEVINYDDYKYPIMDLYFAGKACDLYGLMVAQTDPKKALTYWEAAFTLGARMYHERMVHEEFRAGMLVMGEASYVIGHAKDQAEQLAGAAFEATADGQRLVAAIADAKTAADAAALEKDKAEQLAGTAFEATADGQRLAAAVADAKTASDAAPKDDKLQAAVETAKANLAKAKAPVVEADAAVQATRGKVEALQAALATAKANLAKAKAPFVDADAVVQLCRGKSEAAQNFYDQSYTPWTQGASRAATTYAFLYTFDPDALAQRIGDIFYLALHSKEHLWRTEALLTLGRCRYNLGGEQHGGDQRTAVRLLRKWSSAQDPEIRAAATAGYNLSLDDFHWIRPRTLPQ